ncbi:alpha-hydroxy-acid oxidizing protein [Streptomyces uncialis]|uniref:alpha-hydroxy acid oxidase n=1 Tax=Streptomyces uncialis TaxID=1048205 RepID=UPI002E2EBAA6|nr:alpha-hydroxy acid oxidase [Streptomyces uncialis]
MNDAATNATQPPPAARPTAPVPHPAALDYCFGAAGDESTMIRNQEGFTTAMLVPRVLTGASGDPTTAVTGGTIVAPVLVAPMGLQGLLHPRAEAAAAAAAAAAGLGFCLSTFSSASAAEVVAAAGDGLRWRQVYLTRNAALNQHLIDEAEDLGFQAIVVTVDVPAVGHRPRDLAHRFERFAAAPPALVNSAPVRNMAAETGCSPREILDEVFPNPDTTWADVAALIAGTRLPVLVKGILHPADALHAMDVGAAGVVVSNHGGRQFERSITSIEALPAVVAAVAGAGPVYLDSGVRRPADVAVALSLGARAVLLGRPVLDALAAGGAASITGVLQDFIHGTAEIMTVLGAHRPDDLRQAKPAASVGLRRIAPETGGPA